MEAPISTDVAQAIKDIAERDLKPYALRSIEIEAANDHDGDPVIRIVSVHGEDGEPVDMRILNRMRREIRSKLLELGESRFPHMQFGFPENYRIASARR